MTIKNQLLLSLLGGSAAVIAAASAAPAPWSYWLFALGGFLLLLAAAIYLSDNSWRPIKKARRVASWLRLASQKGTQPRKAVERFVFDFFMGIVMFGSLIWAAIFAYKGYKGEFISPVWSFVVAPVSVAVLLTAFFWWFAYRKHRRQEHYRQQQFLIALKPLMRFSQEITKTNVSTYNDFAEKIDHFLRKIRAMHLILHDAKEDPGLVLWLHELDSDSLRLRSKWVVHSDSIATDSSEKLKCHHKPPIFAINVQSKLNKPYRLTYGSIAGFVFLDDDTWFKNMPTVSRMDSANDCKAFDHSFLNLVDDNVKSNFIVGSYLRSALTCIDQNSHRPLAGGYVYPLFVCHSSPLHFTVYDQFLLVMAADAMQSFLTRHRALLPNSVRMVPGDRAIMKSVFYDPARTTSYPRRALEGTRIADTLLATNGLPSGYERHECEISSLNIDRKDLRAVSDSLQVQWPIVNVSENKIVGSETTYGAPSGFESFAQFFAAARGTQAGVLADICLAWKACIEKPNGLRFLRLETATLLEEECKEFLMWLAQHRPRSVIVVRDWPDQPSRLAEALRTVTDLNLPLCLDKVVGPEALDRAKASNAGWVKFDVHYSRAALVNRQGLEALVTKAVSLKMQPVIQGIEGPKMISLAKDLASGGDAVHASGRDYSALLR